MTRSRSKRSHPCASTTLRIRRAIQASGEKNTVLAKRHGVNRQTVAKWKARESTDDQPMGPKSPPPRLLSREEEAIILAYRCQTRLPGNACLDRLGRLIPKLTRSALYRCLGRYGLGRIGSTSFTPPLTSAALRGPYTFEITACQVIFRDDGIGIVDEVFLAVEEVTKHLYAEVLPHTPGNAAAFVGRLAANFSQRINRVTTYIDPLFTGGSASFDEDMAEFSHHRFGVACRRNRIVHSRTILRFTKPLRPKNGAVEIRERPLPKVAV